MLQMDSSAVWFVTTYPLDSNLSSGHCLCYLHCEQLAFLPGEGWVGVGRGGGVQKLLVASYNRKWRQALFDCPLGSTCHTGMSVPLDWMGGGGW